MDFSWSLSGFRMLIMIDVFQVVGKYESLRPVFYMWVSRTMVFEGRFSTILLVVRSCPWDLLFANFFYLVKDFIWRCRFGKWATGSGDCRNSFICLRGFRGGMIGWGTKVFVRLSARSAFSRSDTASKWSDRRKRWKIVLVLSRLCILLSEPHWQGSEIADVFGSCYFVRIDKTFNLFFCE